MLGVLAVIMLAAQSCTSADKSDANAAPAQAASRQVVTPSGVVRRSAEPAVETLLKDGVRVYSDTFKALSPAQQAEVLWLAKARNLVVVGDEQRY
jgi:DNA replication initiation complex subunit (GINS family)